MKKKKMHQVKSEKKTPFSFMWGQDKKTSQKKTTIKSIQHTRRMKTGNGGIACVLIEIIVDFSMTSL
jgi:hypothetical protein